MRNAIFKIFGIAIFEVVEADGHSRMNFEILTSDFSFLDKKTVLNHGNVKQHSVRSKGQIISQAIFVFVTSSKKRTKKI